MRGMPGRAGDAARWGLRRLAALAIAVACCLAPCACGVGSGDATPSDTGTASAPPGRLAASMTDYIKGYLDPANEEGRDEESRMSDAQRAILERAAQTGGISAADYEAAWNSYTTCVTDLGYSEPLVIHYPNGMAATAATDMTGVTQEQQMRFARDNAGCWNRELDSVNDIYRRQVGNPELLTDPEQAIVDCFHKAGAVPDGYTKEQWHRQWTHVGSDDTAEDASDYSVDFTDPLIAGCMAADGYSYFDGSSQDAEYWHPFP